MRRVTQSDQSSGPVSQRILWMLAGAAVLAAYSGILVTHGRRLWSHDYFRFYPVYVLAVIGLMATRAGTAELPPRQSWRIGPISFGMAVISLAAAIGFWSPWLGVISFVFLGDAFLSALPTLRSVWRLLALLIPLPMGLDSQLIQKLQLVSSHHASQILDVLSVHHLMRGNVLELTGQRFFVEEACSGISSIYLLMAVTVLYAVATRIRMIRGVPLLLSVFWWAIVANDIRIVSIAAAHHYFGFDLATGLLHELLGIGVLFMALAGIRSTEMLLSVIFGPVGANLNPEAHEFATHLSPAILWDLVTTPNRSLVYPHVRLPYSVLVPRRTLLKVVSTLLLVAGTGYWTMVVAENSTRTRNLTEPDNSDDQHQNLNRFELLNRNSLKNLAGCVTQHFDTIERSNGTNRDVFGAFSKTWKMQTPVGDATVAVDGPFNGWHDLRMCYQGQGWRMVQTEVDSVPGQVPGQYSVHAHMLNDQGMHADLHFCLMYPNGALLTVPLDSTSASVTTQLRERLRRAAVRHHSETLWQVQLLIPKNGPSLKSEVAADRQLFGQAVAVVSHHWTQPRQAISPAPPFSNVSPNEASAADTSERLPADE